MNLRQRLKEIIDFLKPYQNIWQNEIMLLYPNDLTDYPSPWLSDLLRFDHPMDLLKLERKEVMELIEEPTLRNFYQRRSELIEIPESQTLPPMPETPFTFLYMIPKKQHEIRQLAPQVHALYQSHKIDKIVDIGGGIGLLAQTLVNEYNLKVCSLDLDAKMQQTGFERHQKNAKHAPNYVEYKNLKIDPKSSEFLSVLEKNFMTVGLHTCGSLASEQMKASVSKKIKSIVNFGCCYHKIENFEDQSLSEFTKNDGPLLLSRFALTLASRAHLKLHDDDFELKLRVKYFRYAIHFLLCDHLNTTEMMTLGNSKKELYFGDFGTYAMEQLRRLNLDKDFTKESLNEFYHQERIQKLINRMLKAGIIRDSFGRLLELYLLLDRAVYLEENGYEVRIEQCFDEIISPRNIGIFSQLR